MAALENGWYQGSIPFYQIEEICIATSGSGIESWDGSPTKNGSIMCYRVGTKVNIVCDDLTVIGDNAFHKFLALKRITGLGSVVTIGAFAFCYTPNIEYIDIIPGNLTSIGASAFCLSSAEDVLDLSVVSASIIGDKATRLKRWSASGLSAVQNAVFDKSIYLDVPNPDSQKNYQDIPYGVYNGELVYVSEAGCASFAAGYHMWNCMYAGTDKQYSNWLDWFNATINGDGKFSEIDLTDNSGLMEKIVEKQGWIYGEEVQINDVTQLNIILNRLLMGLPTYVVIPSYNYSDALHAVLVVGCDVNTHKLAFVDSASTDNIGTVSWLSFEDVFSDADPSTSRLAFIDYHFPMLAANSTWFTQGGTSIKRSSITEIHIKDSYTPTETVASSWDASSEKNGGVMAYVEGTKLTLAGNGSGKILMNPDSSFVFADASGTDRFSAVTRIVGAEWLDASRVTALNRAFQLSGITFVNVGNWRTFNVTNMQGTFDRCTALPVADVSNWQLSSCTSIANIFQGCAALETVDLGKWDVGKVTTMSGLFLNASEAALTSVGDLSNWNTENVIAMNAMFEYCSNLEEVNVGNFNTKKVTNMKSMFRNCYAIKKLDTANWDTSACTNMSQMFIGCHSLEFVDTSKWDVSNVSDFTYFVSNCSALRGIDLSGWNVRGITNSLKMAYFFQNNYNLRKITLGENFSRDAFDIVTNPNYTANLPTPSADYIEGANGNWYDIDGNSYAPDDVPNESFGVYYATPALATDDANQMVLIKKGSLMKTAIAIRERAGTNIGYAPAEFADAILEIV